MSDLEIITQYRDIVHEIHSLRHRIAWNICHGLPVLFMPNQVDQLMGELLRFEMILDSIPDRRTRNIIRCRYTLGMSEHDTAGMMDVSRGTIDRICKATLQRMS